MKKGEASKKFSMPKLDIKQVFMLNVAGIINATGVTLFLVPSGILDGGISGLSVFLNSVTAVHLSIYIVVLNFPLFFVGFKKQGIVFIIYSLIAIAAYSLMNFLYQNCFGLRDGLFELLKRDMVLCSIFGGLVSGIGSGLTIRFGGAIDGVEVMAVLFAKRIGITVGQFVMIFNILLYCVAAMVSGKLEICLYSIITYTVGLKAVDFIVDGFDKSKLCIIVTNQGLQMAEMLSQNLGRGITLLDSKGYYSKESRTMLYCVVNRFEIVKAKKLIASVDTMAFVTISEISEVLGNSAVKYSSRFSKERAEKIRQAELKRLAEDKIVVDTAAVLSGLADELGVQAVEQQSESAANENN